jgi:hypothetical protein
MIIRIPGNSAQIRWGATQRHGTPLLKPATGSRSAVRSNEGELLPRYTRAVEVDVATNSTCHSFPHTTPHAAREQPAPPLAAWLSPA